MMEIITVYHGNQCDPMHTISLSVDGACLIILDTLSTISNLKQDKYIEQFQINCFFPLLH